MLQIPKLEDLSFLIYGLGLSGRSVIKFFVKNKINNFKVWDDNKKKISKKLRPTNLFETLNKVDFIVLAPGISLIKNKNLIQFKKKIITDIDLFYLSKNQCKSVVVTGSNGKSTTCKLLAHLLKKNKLRFVLGGNIGTPILNLKVPKNGFAIIEASSFQLAHSKFISPDYAFFLNLSNDHLDWHGNMSNYLNSKLKIFKLQTKNQFALINKNLKKIFLKNNFLSKIIVPEEKGYQRIMKNIKNNYLTSEINTENMSFIYTFAKLLNIKEKSFISSMKSFKGLPHRFEIFLKKENIVFINDSKATSFKATEPALRSLNNIYWILGGLPKKKDKIDISNFKKKIVKCYLIGNNVEFFKKQIKNRINFTITNNLKKTISSIIKDIKIKKDINKSILLSPAAASFDQFKNFEKRGNEFKRICRKYARNFS
tara:strand:- start:12845 stop:14122 length:1278 start_codon:yes stop_codon:yes gene_type:complete